MVVIRTESLWQTEFKLGDALVRMYRSGYSNTLENVARTLDDRLKLYLDDDYKKLPDYHTHCYHELYYQLGGGQVTVCADRKYIADNNCCYIIPAGVLHYRHFPDTMKNYAVRFSIDKENPNDDGGIYSAFCGFLGDAKHIIWLSNPAQIKPYLERICTRSNPKIPLIEQEIQALMSLLIMELIHAERPVPDDLCPKKLRGDINILIDSWLNQHYYQSGCNIKALSEAAGVSVRQLQRNICELYGNDFRHQVMSMRLYAAKCLLSNSQLSFSDIAQKCGYRAPSGLSNAIKKILGTAYTNYNPSRLDNHGCKDK